MKHQKPEILTIVESGVSHQHSFLAQVDLGVAKYDCKNYGICRIKMVHQIEQIFRNKKFENRSVLANVQVNKEGKVEMFFLTGSMSEDARKTFFSYDQFLVEEDFEFAVKHPCEASAKVNWLGKIPMGEYEIIFRSWGYWVKFFN